MKLVKEASKRILCSVFRKPFTLENNLSRLAWLKFPGLIKMLAMLQGAFFIALAFNPAAVEMIAPRFDLVMKGEVWRIFSWVLMPPFPPQAGASLVFPAFITFIILRLCCLFEDTMETAWGVTRTSLYVYATIICQSIALIFFPFLFLDRLFYLSLFFVFATLLPNYTFLLMFVLPVKVWIFAAITGVFIAISCIQQPLLSLFYLIAYLPYLVWALPIAFRWRKNRHKITQRRNQFQGGQKTANASLHQCHSCGRTENSDPDLQFRVADDDAEYCLDHLP